MQYIESPSNDAFFNMALEEYVFEALPRTESYFMLWQNKNAVVVGKYQNTAEEINSAYVREHGVQVVRRLSGGGAMYQDMGNLNFTYVVDRPAGKGIDFSIFTTPVVEALAEMGVRAEASSRNDITIDGQKISGNSQYHKDGRTMHHGTLLFDSDLETVASALQVRADKIASKGVKSVRSRVTNIAQHLPAPITMAAFRQALVAALFRHNAQLGGYSLTPADMERVQALRDEKYATWQWNYGRSPAYSLLRRHRYPFGEVAVSMEVAQGTVRGLAFYGDFFGNSDPDALAGVLVGTPLREDALLAVLAKVRLTEYIHGMDAESLVHLLLG